jgi:hypothetical protein
MLLDSGLTTTEFPTKSTNSNGNIFINAQASDRINLEQKDMADLCAGFGFSYTNGFIDAQILYRG